MGDYAVRLHEVIRTRAPDLRDTRYGTAPKVQEISGNDTLKVNPCTSRCSTMSAARLIGFLMMTSCSSSSLCDESCAEVPVLGPEVVAL
jgi:hypothetical protein